jgi:hypothetical protein
MWAPVAAPAPLPARSEASIPPPGRFEPSNPALRCIRLALESLQLNFISIRQGAELPRATRPIEVLQPIQALAQARLDYLDSVLAYNRAQFQLKRAIGKPP